MIDNFFDSLGAVVFVPILILLMLGGMVLYPYLPEKLKERIERLHEHD